MSPITSSHSGFEPGKGSAYDYIPNWLAVPKLYSLKNHPNPTLSVKLFALGTNWTWYVLEYNPDEDLCFGLVEGFETELGYFSLAELRELKIGTIPRVERDLFFAPIPIRELSVYQAKWGSREPYPDTNGLR